MTMTALNSQVRDIVVEEVLPHTPEKLWLALTDGALIARWLMAPSGFEAVVGKRFTFTTKPAGEWDGTIQCQVREVVPNQRLVYTWNSGHESNVGYGARLQTVVTWTLTKVAGGTLLRLVHAGFQLPRNELAYTNMGEGWRKIFSRLDALAAEAPAESA